MSYKHFSEAESAGLDRELMSKLDTAREVAGIAFIITSGLRTCAANTAALGVEHSTHIQGLAVDLGLGHLEEGIDRDTARFRMLRGLSSAGFRRIGIYAAHVHVDVGAEPNYAQGVIWMSAAT